MHFDFAITYQPGSLGAQPDALSRRPNHRPQKEGKTNKNPNEFQFLKPHQIKNFPLEESSQILASLIAATAEPEIQSDILDDIKRELPNDKQIDPYLQYLRDSTIPRPEDTQEYLANFIMEDELVLKLNFIYVLA